MYKKAINSFKVSFSTDFLNTFLNHGFKLVSGPLLLVLLPTFIDEKTQGFWFSFMSLSSLSVLADMGFTIIILQFAAHEFAYLVIKKNIFFPKDKVYFDKIIKLATLLKFVVIWSLILIVLTFPIILIIGYQLFGNSFIVSWELPWILFVCGSAVSFLNNIFLSFFEGCDNVSKTQRMRFYNSFVYFIILFFSLIFNKGLFALSNAILISSILTSLYIYIAFKFQIIQLLRIARAHSYSWFNEFWGYFSKYGLSVVIGYISVQLYTPLVFKYYGAEAAGKIGLTMSLSTAIFSIGNVWFQSIAPKFNILTAEKNWLLLDIMFYKALKNTLITYSVVCICFVISYELVSFSRFEYLIDRFLPLYSIVILMIHWFIQNFIYSYAFYLRSFKKEPYLMFSLLCAILFICLTFVGFKVLKVDMIFIVHLITSILSLPFAIYIYRNKKKKWVVNSGT